MPRRLLLLLLLLWPVLLRAQSVSASGGATISGKASVNAVCNPTCALGALSSAGVAQPASNFLAVPSQTHPILLFGSQTWDDLQDQDTSASPAAFNFTNYIAFLKSHNHNATILWHKDIPQFCNWGAGGTWRIADSGFPWARSATTGASDGGNKWDLSTFNQSYFDRTRARALQLYGSGLYAVVELFDGLGLTVNRCGNSSPTGDGFPFTGVNNINSVDDGYTSGAQGEGSMTMTSLNSINTFQDAYIRKIIDTLNDVPNVIWEISEEAPTGSTFWQNHVISVIQSYEATKPFQHQVLYPTLNVNSPNDPSLYNSAANMVAPLGATSIGNYHVVQVSGCGTGAPACKTILNDSDHSYFGLWQETNQQNRNFLWENVTRGASVMFMDPYAIFAGASNPNWTNRNNCITPVNGVCTGGVDTRYDNFRDNFGYAANLVNSRVLNLAAMSASTSLCSTTYCLANNANASFEFIVYAPSGGAFTVNLSNQSAHNILVQWLDPANGAYTAGTTIQGGSSTQSFTPPWGSARDAILYLQDNGTVSSSTTLGWTKFSTATTVQGNGRDQCPPNNFGGTSYSFGGKCAGAWNAWTSLAFDSAGPNGPRMLGCSNGGHSDYLGNECYELNPRTNNALRLNNPSTTFAATCGSPDASAPGSGHTYGFNIKSPRLNRLYIWARITGDTLGDGCASFNMWSLDTTTISQSCAPTCSASWAQITPAGLPSSENIVMSSAAPDLSSGLIWVWESFNGNGVASISKFDDVANTWTKTASLSTNATLYGSLGVDTLNQAVVVMSTPNDAPNPGGSFWCDISTGCTSINHPSLDASCSPIAINGSALTYDTLRQELVGWPGSGGTVYIVNVNKLSNTVTCVAESYGTVIGTDIPESFNGGTPMFNKFHYDAPDDLYMLCANINTTCWKLKRPPVVRATNTSAGTLVSAPLSVSQAFAQGDIPQFPQALINGSTVLTQSDVKQRWSDGSVRYAIVSFLVPSLAASATQKIYFVNQPSGNNTGQLLKSDILAPAYNFDMQIQSTGAGPNHTSSALSMLNATSTIADPGSDPSGASNGICRYWLKGPVVTSVICDDRNVASRSFDFQQDGTAGAVLHPSFECWFYPQDKSVDCLGGVENTWASTITANSMHDQLYNFTLTGGNTSPITLFTQPNFTHIGRSRWVKNYCINGPNKGQLNGCSSIIVDHNAAYEAYAKAIPNFDPAINIPASMTTGNAWVTGDQSIPGTSSGPPDGSGGVGQYGKDMNTGGTSQWFGILNTWEAMYWFSHGSTGMLNQVLGNSQVGGRIPFHYREGDNTVSATNLFYDAGGTVPAGGRTISVNARPMENWGIGTQVSQFNDTCGGANTLTLNMGSPLTDDGWISGGGSGGMDGSHWPEFGYTAALITGKFWYVEEAQMSGAYMVGLDRGCPSGHRNGSMGIIWSTQEGRGTAWMTRAALWAWAVSPDGSPEQVYYFDKLQNNGAYHQGKYGTTNTDSSRLAAYNFGVTQQDDPTHNPLHIYLDGWYGSFVEAPLDTTAGHLLTGTSPWEEQYTVVVEAQARDMGFTNYDSVLNYQAKRMLHLALDSNWGGIFMIGTYRMASKLVSSGTWIQTAADYLAGFTQGNGSGLATTWTDQVHSQKPCDFSAEDDHGHAAPLAELGLFYPYTVDGLSGRVAYDTARASLYGAAGCMPGMFNNPAIFTNPSPKWDIVPRR